jgi:hypothetical protein
MSNKNPFEIRADMVQLAKEYMDKQWEANMDLMNNMYDQGKATVEQVQEAYKPYTVEEMMKKAQEMYSFVSKKD